jgi:cellulose synthase/poly-beta-1,6-N-acetylglucosamine synthase-like glycosyltransferase
MKLAHRTRFWGILPGAMVWTTLVIAIVLSILKPLWMVYFIILFDLYWLIRICYFLPFLIHSWWRYRRALRVDWQAKVEQLPGYAEITQVIFLPFSKEGPGILLETLQNIAQGNYPAERLLIVLAGEGQYADNASAVEKEVQKRFSTTFGQLFFTLHPPGLPDEIRGKGSNLHWAAKQVVPRLLEQGVDPDKTIVSSFDADTIVHAQYFSYLAHLFLTVPEPTRSSYQPVALYNNNLWESPAPVRVAMFGTTFWLLTELGRPEGMMTFSSHSMSLRMLMDVGYWQKDIVSEDSRIFLQGLVHYNGRYRVTPMYLPVSMDTVMTGDYWKALLALYKQLRRWAWGVENFPYMVKAFSERPDMKRSEKWWWTLKQLEGTYTWSTAPFLIFILGYLPFFVAPEAFRGFAIFQNTPFTLQWLMRFSMIGLFTSAFIAMTLLPPRPKHLSRPVAIAIMLLQWLLLPVTFVLFSAVPALDAQTRMMLGKKLGFNVSPKRKV